VDQRNLAAATLNANILIVEDDPTTARYLELSLKRMGCQQVRIASSSQGALDAMRQQAAELVLMDIDIDGNRDGIETTKLLRAEFDVPVIFLTGYNDEVTMARARQVRPLAYLVKPVKSDELRNSITLALYTHQLASRRPSAVALSPVPLATVAQAGETELHRLKAEVAAVAVHDFATGLFNRRGFHLLGEQQLMLAQRLGAPMTLLSLTVHNMLPIEIEFGAAARDQVRQDLAAILRSAFPTDIAGRMEDDVFVLLSAEQGRKAVSDALQTAIAVHNAAAVRAYEVKFEIRVASRSADCNLSIGDLLARATEVGAQEVDDATPKGLAKNRRGRR
jgi:diguanylate cyclase (GGDEF)-like protein